MGYKQVLFLAIAFLFFFGCSQKEYFKPLEVNGEVSFDSKLPSEIVDTNKSGAILENRQILTQEGLSKVEFKEGETFLGFSQGMYLFNSHCQELVIYDNKGKEKERMSIAFCPVSATIYGGEVAMVSNENTMYLYDLKSKSEIFSKKTNSNLLYVVDNGNNAGYVVIAGDDIVGTPVLGYSENGSFNYNEMPENLQWWLSEYGRQIEYAIENGISNVELLAYTVPIENSITIQTRSIMGTEIPHVKYVPDAGKPTYSFSTTHESIDKAREAFRKVKDLTVKLSMVENAAYRLASNIKKTQKRANALQNITIPMYSALVYTITNALEEKEREEFTRLKVIKRMKMKKG